MASAITASSMDGTRKRLILAVDYAAAAYAFHAKEETDATRIVASRLPVIEVFHRENAYCFVGVEEDGTAIVSFEGTDPPKHLETRENRRNVLADWRHNLDTIQVPFIQGKVHKGFYEHLCLLWPLLDDWRRRTEFDRMRIHGHSLGSALATIYGFIVAEERPEMRVEVAVVSTPRVFDPTAAFFVDHCLPNLRIVRLEAVGDWVTEVPGRVCPPYDHVGLGVYVAPDGSIRTEERPTWLKFLHRFPRAMRRIFPWVEHGCPTIRGWLMEGMSE